eukprot:595076-Pyramimonas_sp.AAC.1
MEASLFHPCWPKPPAEDVASHLWTGTVLGIQCRYYWTLRDRPDKPCSVAGARPLLSSSCCVTPLGTSSLPCRARLLKLLGLTWSWGPAVSSRFCA